MNTFTADASPPINTFPVSSFCSVPRTSVIYHAVIASDMTEIDPSTVEAKKAYNEDGHCKLNNLICTDGDCRQCSFVTDGSLMITLDTLCHELQHIRARLGDSCDGGCDCDCGCH